MRALVLMALVALAGCGDDKGTSTQDLSVPAADLAGSPATCGSDGVMLSCAGVSGGTHCYICDFGGGGQGHCARPCSLLAPDCPTGQQCRELTASGDGSAPNIAVEGNGCADTGFCR